MMMIFRRGWDQFKSTSVLNAVSTRTELKVRSGQGSIADGLTYLPTYYLSLSVWDDDWGRADGWKRRGGKGGGGGG